jgi:signal transduction histidine kinase/DNA-binding response OmpR family regulator
MLRALARVSTQIAEGLSEERLVANVTRSVVDAAGAELAAVYLQPEHSGEPRAWRLGGHCGGDPDVLAMLPTVLGTGTGVLAPVFQNAREVYEPDLLDGADDRAAVPQRLPARSVVGLPIRRREGRAIGALIVGANCRDAFDDVAIATYRSIAHLLAAGVDNARLIAAQQRERRMAVETQATLGTVLESVDTGICVTELDSTLRVANTALQEMFGLPSNPIGTAYEPAFNAAKVKARDEHAFLERVRQLFADPAAIDESEWELATDPPRIVQRYSAPMRNQVGEIVGRVCVYNEMTESRRLYTQLLNSEKLRAIGEMASGVAHDFNNLLASILGQVELLHPDELPPSTREAISTIRQSALDGARIVRNLQGLAKPRADTPSSSADLNETAQAALDMARPRFAAAALHGHGAIEVTLNLADPANLARVAIDPAELREVLLNLLFNAGDAMPDGGRIEIATRLGQASRTAELVVSDTGHGMPESVRARIFEPFFSTKGPKGTGLGLAVAYSIVTRSGGNIAVESATNQGTTFTITLPFVPIGAPTAPAPAKEREVPRRSETPSLPPLGTSIRGARILVADDEPGLVAIVRQLMERSGADVTIAHGGTAALEAIRGTGAKFDVVITDLDMPEVDGWAVAAEVKSQLPGTHVVMLTGWAGEIAPEDFRARGVDVVLAKPCSRAELEAAIGSLLATKPATGFQVLLVDDEPAFARAVRDLLTLQGHSVTLVDSAAAALKRTSAESFDVVLTDYSLGEMNGAELAERLAHRADGPYVILMTGYATEIDDPSLLSEGVDAVLPKPCRGDDLRQVLARVPGSG